MSIIIIKASSRKEGNSKKLISSIQAIRTTKVIDLLDYQISHYDYSNKNRDDDFLPLIEEILNQYRIIIFVTPVYWYSMSGLLKVFFDRITDLLTIQKDLGRKFRGKKIAVITTSEGDNLGDDFWLPFKSTATYLGMKFIEGLHLNSAHFDNVKLEGFLEKIERSL